jgi:uncharacterized protein YkwD
MNWVDILLIIVFVVSIWAGWRNGFILGSVYLITWTGSLLLAYFFYPYMSNALGNLFNMGPWLNPVSFVVTAVLARILLGVIFHLITRNVPERSNHNPVNKVLGVVPGAINGFIYAVILSALMLSFPFSVKVTDSVRDSRFGTNLAMKSEWVNRKLAPVFNDAIRQTLNTLTVQPGAEETVDLHFTYTKAKPRPDLEAEMLKLVNAERVKNGLRPLAADPQLLPVARAQSNDMFMRGYFAHNNPEGKTPFDRMKDAKVNFLTAGENLALAQTLEIAHNGLMNSPGHRANILNPSFGRVGIGIMDGGFYGLMISQEFRN